MRDLLTSIQRSNKFQTRKLRRDTLHRQLEATNTLITHEHFDDEGKLISTEFITELEGLVLERKTAITKSRREAAIDTIKADTSLTKEQRSAANKAAWRNPVGRIIDGVWTSN